MNIKRFSYKDSTGNIFGPLPITVIQRLFASGTIHSETPLLSEGQSEWRAYSVVFAPRTDPQTSVLRNPVDPKLVGIAGWLLLPALNLILAVPVRLFYIAAFNSSGLPTTPINIGLELILLLFGLYAAAVFFQKLKSAPRVMIAFIITSFLVALIQCFTGGAQFGPTIVHVLPVIIWSLYFSQSQRVAYTFTR